MQAAMEQSAAAGVPGPADTSLVIAGLQDTLRKRFPSTFEDLSMLVSSTQQQEANAKEATSSSQSTGTEYGQAELEQYSECSSAWRASSPPLDMGYLTQCLQDEYKAAANPAYLTTVQREMDGHKRLVLVDWLIEVVDEFTLRQETLFLAVNLLDRFLSVRCAARGELQLAGVTALWVAAKYEEVYPPVLADFVDITDHAYQAEHLIGMERRMLEALRFQLAVPTPLTFLHQLLDEGAEEGSDEKGRASSSCMPASGLDGGGGAAAASLSGRRLVHLSEYFLELMLLTPESLRWRPSVLAAAALRMARAQVHTPWPDALTEHVAAEAGADMVAVSVEMVHMARWAASVSTKRPMVWSKYAQAARSHASTCFGNGSAAHAS